MSRSALQYRPYRFEVVFLLWIIPFAGLLAMAASGQVATPNSQPEAHRLNAFQFLGTHNSYHLAPHPKLLAWIATAGSSVANSIDYTHAPLVTQLSEYGVRQLELDLYADPKGGLYSEPVGRKLIGEKSDDPRLEYDFAVEMSKPGTKILHSPGFDFASNAPSLNWALQRVVAWSISHPDHAPILILLEFKETAIGPAAVQPLAFDAKMLENVEQEIRRAVPQERILTPDAVRGDRAHLRDAVREHGWPTLESARGKLIFAMDNTDRVREVYLDLYPGLQGALMFASVDEDHPAAAWIKLNDPIGDFDRIVRCVQQGMMVRTRADADTIQARSGDTTRRERALASGAHWISTDYPVPDPRWSEYRFQWPDGRDLRENPITHSDRGSSR